MTIVIHWWIIPLIITCIAMPWAFIAAAKEDGMFSGIAAMVFIPVATCVSLLAWLVGALCK